MSVVSWVTDVILVLLLSGTLAMAIRLDRALRVVRRDRAAFEALITNLGAAMGAVKQGIQTLRCEAEQAAEQIGRRADDADKIATDLSFLIEAADRAGGALEQRMKAFPADPAGATKPRRSKAARSTAPQAADTPAAPIHEPPSATAALHALAPITMRHRAGAAALKVVE